MHATWSRINGPDSLERGGPIEQRCAMRINEPDSLERGGPIEQRCAMQEGRSS
jgi:hypothetical protein